MSILASTPLFEMDAVLEPDGQNLGATPVGQRIIAIATGGTIKGARINGVVLPGGGDWMCLRSDGSFEIDVRACLKTHDGVLIYMTYGGRLVLGPNQMPAMASRETSSALDPASYYFRTTPLFEAPVASRYAWLNHIVAIGVGRMTSTGVAYAVHEIL